MNVEYQSLSLKHNLSLLADFPFQSSKSIPGQEQTNMTSAYWQVFAFSFQLILWNEPCDVALISKAVASLFHHRKSARKKNRLAFYFRVFLVLDIQVYWTFEMVVFNQTGIISEAEGGCSGQRGFVITASMWYVI